MDYIDSILSMVSDNYYHSNTKSSHFINEKLVIDILFKEKEVRIDQLDIVFDFNDKDITPQYVLEEIAKIFLDFENGDTNAR